MRIVLQPLGRAGPGAAALALALAAAAPAAAQEVELATCLFARECPTGEACADTAFELSVVAGEAEGAEAPLALRSIAGDIPVTLSADGAEGRTWLGLDGLDAHALTILPGGAALYTAQIPDAKMALTYLGECGETR